MSKEFVPLSLKSHYSLLLSTSKSIQLAERCQKLNYRAAALCDVSSLAGSVQHVKACREVCLCGHQANTHEKGKSQCLREGCDCKEYSAKPIKPILGYTFQLCEKDASIKDSSNRKLSNISVLAKNLAGWTNLIRASSESNKQENVYYDKPRLALDKLAGFADNSWIVYSGSLGTQLADCLFMDCSLAYKAKTYEEAKALVRTDWKEVILKLGGEYAERFGRNNFYLEVRPFDGKAMPAAEIVAKIMRWLAPKIGVACVATTSSYYIDKADAQDQRISLCAQFESTLTGVERKLDLSGDSLLANFFKSNAFHLPAVEEFAELHSETELKNTLEIAEKVEDFEITKKPTFPVFECPSGLTPLQYIKNICEVGWKNKVEKSVEDAKQENYKQRLDMELNVIDNFGFSPYFLIVQDYINFAVNVRKCLVGRGRGSSAGSLVANLLNITDIDPIIYNLPFERFINAARGASLPDIDSDFPKNERENVISYIRSKYGDSRVCQMITYGRMQGKSAIKDVMRAHQACSFDEMNKINKFIPDEAEISDQLQLMKEATGESSIIRWALENNADGLREWCYLDDKGELQGEFAPRFKQAIRLEGTKRSKGKHASGIIISPVDLDNVCPMVYDSKTKLSIAGMEMGDLEALGLVKFDILGTTVLDKLQGIQELLEFGEIKIGS